MWMEGNVDGAFWALCEAEWKEKWGKGRGEVHFLGQKGRFVRDFYYFCPPQASKKGVFLTY